MVYDFFLEHDLKLMNEDKRYAYITYYDLRTSLPARQTTMVVKAPPESKVEVPEVLPDNPDPKKVIYNY